MTVLGRQQPLRYHSEAGAQAGPGSVSGSRVGAFSPRDHVAAGHAVLLGTVGVVFGALTERQG
jgi:hypothetical protein